jgi:hypothetical protein
MADLQKTNVFSPKGHISLTRKQQVVPTAFSDRIAVPHLPDNTTVEVRNAFAYGMMMCGTSESKLSAEWKAYLPAYTVVVVPGLKGKMAATAFSFTQLSSAQVQDFADRFSRFQLALVGRDPSAISLAKVDLESSPCMPGLPLPKKGLEWEEGFGEWEPKIYLSHYSIVLFLAGKRIEGEDHSSVAVKRPDALKRKGHMTGTIAFLDGKLRISDSAHLLVNNAWAEMSSLRSVCFTEFAKYEQMETDITQDLIYTTMHLLKFSGMAHAKITYGFLKAYPWVHEVPSLKTSLGVYVESIRAAAKYPAAIQPYVKLIYGDKAEIFPRKELEPLVACAVASESEVNDSLMGFYTSGEFGPIVDAFLNERNVRAVFRLKKLGISEQEEEEEEEEFEEVAQDSAEVAEAPTS